MACPILDFIILCAKNVIVRKFFFFSPHIHSEKCVVGLFFWRGDRKLSFLLFIARDISPFRGPPLKKRGGCGGGIACPILDFKILVQKMIMSENFCFFKKNNFL